MAKYLSIRLTERQARAADAALVSLIARSAQAHEIAHLMDQTYKWEQEAIFRLRAAIISALNRSDWDD